MEASARRWGALAALWLAFTPLAARAAEPCKLLTAQEVGQVLGAPIASTTPLGATGCLWAAGVQRVSLVLRPATAWARITTPGPGMVKTSVGGLGDAASLSGLDPATHPGQGADLTLSVEQGANVIVVTVYGVTGARQSAAEQTLARLALPRL